jgi:hypothetical protein
MRTTAWILATLIAIGIGVALNQEATAEGTDGACIASCNEECNQLPGGGERKDCKTACFAGRCSQPGALQVAATSGEAGLDCEEDQVCNEFCADGPVLDTPDCDPTPALCPCDYSAVAMTADMWQCADDPLEPDFYCGTQPAGLFGYDLSADNYYDSDFAECSYLSPARMWVTTTEITCPNGGPMCAAITHGDPPSVQILECDITMEQAQACADDVLSYAQALDSEDNGVTVNFDTNPADCPPLAP